LFISKPVLGRVSKKWSIQITRRITMPDGSFGGVVVVSLDQDYLTQFYRSIDIGANGNVSLVGTDGIVRARASRRSSGVGESVAGGEMLRHFAHQKAGVGVSTSRFDGVERMFSYRAVQGYPLIVTVGLAIDEILGVYYQNRRSQMALAALLTLWVLAVTGLIVRHQRVLASARDAAEAGTRSRSEFLAMMSHEIRTPMNGVIGTADLLLETKLDAEQLGLARTMRDSADHLLRIINDVLDFSKLEADRVEIEKIPFDLHGLVRDTVGLLAARAREKNLRLGTVIAPDVPRAVVGDPARLRQILLNLVGNGLKFTKAGGVTVAVSLEPAHIPAQACPALDAGWTPVGRKDRAPGEDAGACCDCAGSEHAAGAAPRQMRLAVSVADTGIGIPSDALPLLFREFSQLDNSIARRFGGTGLGLAICKRLVDLLGGTITVESEVGKGTTFRFTIDCAPASAGELAQFSTQEAPPPPQPALAPAPRAACRILLVEDNLTNRVVAAKLIESLGYSVDVAVNGVEAVAACSAEAYDLVFMDIMMPELDGLAATRAIRTLAPPFNRPHIVALTANAEKHDRLSCLAAGMDDFMTKPVRRSDLAAKLALLRRHDRKSRPTASRPDAAMVEAVPFDERVYAELVEGLGPDSTRVVLETFLTDTARRLVVMRASARSRDAASLKREVHAMKSSAASLGFLRLSQIAKALEAHLPDIEEPALDARIDDVACEFAAIRTIARTRLGARMDESASREASAELCA
ncbi:MAG TPA: ATP-binding protein, partial [Xanthobacteraceae bacterium]|nr:ATP-binding protein [Xanthobacteraceae bacterium]